MQLKKERFALLLNSDVADYCLRSKTKGCDCNMKASFFCFSIILFSSSHGKDILSSFLNVSCFVVDIFLKMITEHSSRSLDLVFFFSHPQSLEAPLNKNQSISLYFSHKHNRPSLIYSSFYSCAFIVTNCLVDHRKLYCTFPSWRRLIVQIISQQNMYRLQMYCFYQFPLALIILLLICIQAYLCVYILSQPQIFFIFDKDWN